MNLRFLGVRKIFRLLMQSCRSLFFSPDLSMKTSNFSKTVHSIFINFAQSFYTQRAPACSKASKSYDWNVWNIDKLSPKTAKKQLFFDFFFNFRKNCPYDTNEIFYSSFTQYYGPLRVISSKSYCWNVRNIAKIIPKIAKKLPYSDFFDFCKNCPYDSIENFYTIVWSFACNFN